MNCALLVCTGLAAAGCGDIGHDAGPDAAPPAPCTDDPCTADGCAPVLLYRFDPFSEGDFGVGGGHVCIAFLRAGAAVTEYRCVERCGGPPSTTGSSPGYPVGMTLDGDDLTTAVSVGFPNGYARVSRLSLATSARTPLWSTDGGFEFENMLRRGNSLYFSSRIVDDLARRGIFRMPYQGGAPQRISEWLVAPIWYGMVRLDDVLYFSSETPGHHGLHSMPIDGGTPTLLYRPVFQLTSVTARNGRLFWAELDESGDGGLVKTSALDGSDLRTLATLPGRVLDVVVDDETVYVGTEEGARMGIRAVPIAGGGVAVALSGAPRVDWLAEDTDYLFFVGGDGVYRLRKRRP